MYERLGPDAPLTQGEILDGCPILSWERDIGEVWHASESIERVVLLTQACDLANAKTTRVQVAIVHSADKLVAAGILRPNVIRDQVRRHLVYGWYFLPAGDGIDESIVDLRDLHTIPRLLLEDLARSNRRVCRLITPFREHLVQHFSVTYSRIGLPEPYATEP